MWFSLFLHILHLIGECMHSSVALPQLYWRLTISCYAFKWYDFISFYFDRVDAIRLIDPVPGATRELVQDAIPLAEVWSTARVTIVATLQSTEQHSMAMREVNITAVISNIVWCATIFVVKVCMINAVEFRRTPPLLSGTWSASRRWRRNGVSVLKSKSYLRLRGSA